MILAANSSLRLTCYLSYVHTWAISFLRHLANMSSMAPSVHQLTPALSPIWGSRPKPRRPEEVVYSPNDSCSHFTQRLFLLKLPQRHTCNSLHYTFTIIHTYYTLHSSQQLHSFLKMIIHSFISPGSLWQAGCPRPLVSVTLQSTVCI
jgi:hypothetical protein